MKVKVKLSEARQILEGLKCIDGMMPREKDFENIDPENHAEFRRDRKVIEMHMKLWRHRIKKLRKKNKRKKGNEFQRSLRKRLKALKKRRKKKKGPVRYRIELNKGGFARPHYYTKINTKDCLGDTVDISTFTFWSAKRRSTAEKHLARAKAARGNGKWTIEEYEVE